MEKGLKILLNTYWNSQGWKNGAISKEDFEIAKKEGFMFDYPEYISHDEALRKLDSLLSKIDPIDVANSFLYSLSTRKLEYRSILGSYYYGKAITKHTLYDPFNNSGSNHCYICGWYSWSKEPDDYDLRYGLNVFNFERYKFGGVRHCSIDYVIFDIEQFLKLPKVTPNEKDIEILKRILQCINKLEPHNKIGKLSTIIRKEKIFKSNENEMQIILNILGICGVLSSNVCPCFEEKFVDEYCRSPIEHTNDFAYPVNRWRASDGINITRFEKVFGYKLEFDKYMGEQ